MPKNTSKMLIVIKLFQTRSLLIFWILLERDNYFQFFVCFVHRWAERLKKTFYSIWSITKLYKAGQKNNMSEVTKNYCQILTTNDKFSLSPLSLTHFSILLCYASMHFWKDSPRVLCISIITDLLMASISRKLISWWLPWAWGKGKKSHSARLGK